MYRQHQKRPKHGTCVNETEHKSMYTKNTVGSGSNVMRYGNKLYIMKKETPEKVKKETLKEKAEVILEHITHTDEIKEKAKETFENKDKVKLKNSDVVSEVSKNLINQILKSKHEKPTPLKEDKKTPKQKGGGIAVL